MPLLNRVAVQMARRLASTTAPQQSSQQVTTGGASPRIKKLQELFCKEDGVPVHLKGGAMDVGLYRFTMGLCVLAVGLNFKFYYDCAMKK